MTDKKFNWRKVFITFIIFMIVGICMDYLIYSKPNLIKNIVLATILSFVLEFFEIRDKKRNNEKANR